MKASGWKTVVFGEVVRLEQGLCFNKKTNHLMADKGIPLLRIADLINNTQTKFVDAERVPPRFIANPQDIIFSRTGQVGLVFKGRVGVVHNNCFRVIPTEGIERDYLYWYLRQPAVIARARALAGGAAQPDLGHDAFKSIAFSYPTPHTQRRIAAVLSAYDDLIENCERRIRVLDEMARALYREWFVLFRYPGHENTPLVDSALGRIPQGWGVTKVAELVSRLASGIVRRENAVFASGAVPVVDQSTNEVLGFHDDEPDHIASANDPIAIFGDHTCKMQLLFEPFSVGPNVVPFRAVEGLPLQYLYRLVRGLVHTQEYKRHWSVLMAKEVVVADPAIAARYSMVVQAFSALSESLRKTARALRGSRDLLLPRLLSGQLSVEDAA